MTQTARVAVGNFCQAHRPSTSDSLFQTRNTWTAVQRAAPAVPSDDLNQDPYLFEPPLGKSLKKIFLWLQCNARRAQHIWLRCESLQANSKVRGGELAAHASFDRRGPLGIKLRGRDTNGYPERNESVFVVVSRLSPNCRGMHPHIHFISDRGARLKPSMPARASRRAGDGCRQYDGNVRH
ncbi:hypothetical protein EVAR_6191_1 [Eumeta japonica]|uniref:Uncharacterized protein n=1 Tax=Eumeta variegata TaxID=151549 RepID=A0A4C1TEC4_EUMVA|nr:hypothetical protein EVAR_6191_1 [Eumeta japonica]